jgi:hypothetical protein
MCVQTSEPSVDIGCGQMLKTVFVMQDRSVSLSRRELLPKWDGGKYARRRTQPQSGGGVPNAVHRVARLPSSPRILRRTWKMDGSPQLKNLALIRTPGKF